MKSASLSVRIITLSLSSLFIVLLVTGSIIGWAFNQSIARSLDNQLSAYIDILIAATVSEKETISLEVSDSMLGKLPRYWQVTRHTELIAKSSLLEEALPISQEAENRHVTLEAKSGDKLVVLQKTILFPGNQAVTYLIGMPAAIAETFLSAEQMAFFKAMLIALFILIAALCLLAFLQVRLLTAPLKFVEQTLADIHAGKQHQIDQHVPKELAPLVAEINKLLSYSMTMIERHRTFASNLSHALKTPLTILKNEAQKSSSSLSILTLEKTDELLSIINRNLSRIQTAAENNPLSSHVPAFPIAEKITRQFGKLYQKEVQVLGDELAVFAGNEGDLYELLGNIIENACKYSHSNVQVSVKKLEGKITIAIEDDGPGIPPEKQEEVLSRGVRLDETLPGSGIGLAVASDIITLYQGVLTLEESIQLGGLRVTIELPGV